MADSVLEIISLTEARSTTQAEALRALDPAIDMARKALGLRPEKAARSHWGPWFEKMSAASGPARPASP